MSRPPQRELGVRDPSPRLIAGEIVHQGAGDAKPSNISVKPNRAPAPLASSLHRMGGGFACRTVVTHVEVSPRALGPDAADLMVEYDVVHRRRARTHGITSSQSRTKVR
jgi:hypothetical protein